MANNQNPGLQAHAQHDEAFFMPRVVFIIELDRMVIEKHGLGFGKRNVMFLLVRSILPWIPFELDHACNVFTKYGHVKLA